MDKEGSERSFLILGGTGNVGKHVVLALVAQSTEVPAKVYVGTRQPESFKPCNPSGSQVTVMPVHCKLQLATTQEKIQQPKQVEVTY